MLRIVHGENPLFRTEYLSLDVPPSWTANPREEFIFPTYQAACDYLESHRADERLSGAFPAVRETKRAPLPFVLRRDRDNAPSDFVLPEPPKRKSRKERERQRADELRREDLAELERVEVYE